MLRTNSLKAFVISNIVHLFLFAMIGGALGFALVALRVPLPPLAKGMMPLDGAAILMACLSTIPSSLVAGFVAGRIAEYRPALHGALSSSLFVIREVCGVPHYFVVGWSSRTFGWALLNIILVVAALLLGTLGGYGAAHGNSGANRYNVATASRNRFLEDGLITKLLLSLVVTACICAFILFSPTIFCHGEGSGGNCGEGYMISLPAAMLALPIVFAGTLFLI